MSSKRHTYGSDVYEEPPLNNDAIRDVDERTHAARIGAVVIVVCILIAVFLISNDANAEAKLGDWQDTAWECKRSNSKIFTRPSQVECMTDCEKLAVADGVSKTTGRFWYTCGIGMPVDFIKPPVIPTCTASKPLDETQTATCPAGTVGTFGQTRAYIAAPYPVCWAKGDVWLPVLPPEGTCLPAPSAWTQCAVEGATCQVPTPPRTVRYGADTRWTSRTVSTTSIACGNHVFGDPAPGTVKRCEYSSTATQPEPPDPEPITNGVRWEPVTKGIDGSNVTVREYRVYVSREIATIGAATALVVTDARIDLGTLASGSWYVGVIAVAQGGEVSAMSKLVTKAIP